MCDDCVGKGRVLFSYSAKGGPVYQTCPRCDGYGTVGAITVTIEDIPRGRRDCKVCYGHGRVTWVDGPPSKRKRRHWIGPCPDCHPDMPHPGREGEDAGPTCHRCRKPCGAGGYTVGWMDLCSVDCVMAHVRGGTT